MARCVIECLVIEKIARDESEFLIIGETNWHMLEFDSVYLFLPSIDPGLEKSVLNLFNPKRVQTVRGEQDCPPAIIRSFEQKREHVNLLFAHVLILPPTLGALHWTIMISDLFRIGDFLAFSDDRWRRWLQSLTNDDANVKFSTEDCRYILEKMTKSDSGVWSYIIDSHSRLLGPILRKVLEGGHRVIGGDWMPSPSGNFYMNFYTNFFIEKLLTHEFNLVIDSELLLYSVRSGSVKLVKRLIDLGAKPTLVCLEVAVIHAGESMIRLLLDHGLDINASSQSGLSFLTLAAKRGNLEGVKGLLAVGERIEDHPYLLSAAAQATDSPDRIELIQFLIEAGVNVHTRDPQSSRTPMMLASSYSSWKIMEVLSQHGARLDTDGADIRKDFILSIMCDSFGATIFYYRNGVAEPPMEEIYRELFRSPHAVRRMLLFFLMLKYPNAIVIQDLKLKLLPSISCPEVFKICMLEFDFISLERIKILYERDDLRFALWCSNASPRHILALIAADLQINRHVDVEELFRSLQLPPLSKDSALQYTAQVAAMRGKTIEGSAISFYDILNASIRQIVKFLKNRNIFDALENKENYTEFPAYTGMISRRFRKAYFRRLLLDQGLKVYASLFSQIPDVPEKLYDILEESFDDHWSNEELLRLSYTYKLPSDEQFLNNLFDLLSINTPIKWSHA